jgi:hypothetical protein
MAPALSLPFVQGPVCSNGLYKGLSLLAAVPAAQNFCVAHYPKCATTTVAPYKMTVPGQPNSGVLATDANVLYLLKQLQQLEGNILKTACSCIETQTCVTV